MVLLYVKAEDRKAVSRAIVVVLFESVSSAISINYIFHKANTIWICD